MLEKYQFALLTVIENDHTKETSAGAMAHQDRNEIMTKPYVSPNGYTDDFGPNVSQILAQASRVVRGRIPAQVRKELNAAVKAGVLGRLPKQGLKPEIYFHPAHKHGAKERQNREAAYSITCIATVLA